MYTTHSYTDTTACHIQTNLLVFSLLEEDDSFFSSLLAAIDDALPLPSFFCASVDWLVLAELLGGGVAALEEAVFSLLSPLLDASPVFSASPSVLSPVEACPSLVSSAFISTSLVAFLIGVPSMSLSKSFCVSSTCTIRDKSSSFLSAREPRFKVSSAVNGLATGTLVGAGGVGARLSGLLSSPCGLFSPASLDVAPDPASVFPSVLAPGPLPSKEIQCRKGTTFTFGQEL